MDPARNRRCEGAPQRDFLQPRGEERAGALSPLATKRHPALHAVRWSFLRCNPAVVHVQVRVRSGGERTLSRTPILSSFLTWRPETGGRKNPSRAPQSCQSERDPDDEVPQSGWDSRQPFGFQVQKTSQKNNLHQGRRRAGRKCLVVLRGIRGHQSESCLKRRG